MDVDMRVLVCSHPTPSELDCKCGPLSGLAARHNVLSAPLSCCCAACWGPTLAKNVQARPLLQEASE